MEEFKNQISIDNIWYNYDKDIFEEKEASRIESLIKKGTIKPLDKVRDIWSERSMVPPLQT